MRAAVSILLASVLSACVFDGSNPFLGLGDDTDAGSFTSAPDASAAPDAQVDPGSPDAAVAPDAAPSPQLINDDVVLRYFVDDAPSGTAVATLADSIAPGLDLAIDFDETASFSTVGANTGLEFTRVLGDAGASVSVQGSKLRDALDQASSATIEMVVDMDDPQNFSRLFHVGQGINRGRFSLQGRDDGSLRFTMNDSEKVRWNVDLRDLERISIHLVLDTTEPVDVDRSKLYINGTLIPVESTANLNQNDLIDLPDEADFLFFLGNRAEGDRGWEGVLFYAALYSAPLSEAVIVNNAARLLDNDDALTLGN